MYARLILILGLLALTLGCLLSTAHAEPVAGQGALEVTAGEKVAYAHGLVMGLNIGKVAAGGAKLEDTERVSMIETVLAGIASCKDVPCILRFGYAVMDKVRWSLTQPQNDMGTVLEAVESGMVR